MLLIETQRLLLRNAQPEDAASLYPYRESEFVQRYNAMAPRTYEQMKEEVLRDAGRDNVAYLELKETGGVIGVIGWEVDSLRHRVNAVCTSCWLGEAHANKGYMTEAYRALIEYLFTQEKADVVVARVFADNLASQRMMEKVGFHKEGVLRRAVRGYRGKAFDDILYSILREEWGA